MAAITFSDVLIIPQYSEITSRKDVDLTSDFGPFKMALPLISSNMAKITGPDMAIEMYKNGAIGALHRFVSIDQAVVDFNTVKASGANCMVSIGVQEEDKERFDKLYMAGARIFVVDIANGHALSMKNCVKWIKDKNLSDVYIIGGNIAHGNAGYDLADWGCNAVKVGIGGGSACMTRRNTGVGVPTLASIMDVYEEYKRQGVKNVKIICDGGIVYSGDVSKALKYSDAVMLGNMLSGTTETPGAVFQNSKGQFYKVYAGSASGESKISTGKASDFVEGIAMEVPFKGKVKYILKAVKEGVQSAFSYVGAKNLTEFKDKCQFAELSSGGRIESKI